MKGRFLTFLIGGEAYGIKIANTTEIPGLQPITKMQDYVRGIVNLREDIVLVIDARLRFKKPEMEHTDRACMIVTSNGGVLIGFAFPRLLQFSIRTLWKGRRFSKRLWIWKKYWEGWRLDDFTDQL